MAKAETKVAWLALSEALKRVSFEVLRPYLHTGHIPARHHGLHASGGEVRYGPGNTPPTLWTSAYKDPAGRDPVGRVCFITEWVEDGRVIQEVVYTYTHGIELGGGAFDMHFPAATGPAASADRQLYAEGGSKSAAGAKLAAVPRLGGRKPVVDWKIAEDEIVRLMDHHGEFSPDDQWNAQARLEEAIADFCQSTLKKLPSETQIKKHVRSTLERWRRSRAET